MTKQAIVFTWGDSKRLGYSRLEGETEWTMDMPEVPREVAKIMKLTATDESIEKMAKDTEAENGKVYRLEIDENDDAWTYLHSTRNGEE